MVQHGNTVYGIHPCLLLGGGGSDGDGGTAQIIVTTHHARTSLSDALQATG